MGGMGGLGGLGGLGGMRGMGGMGMGAGIQHMIISGSFLYRYAKNAARDDAKPRNDAPNDE